MRQIWLVQSQSANQDQLKKDNLTLGNKLLFELYQAGVTAHACEVIEKEIIYGEKALQPPVVVTSVRMSTNSIYHGRNDAELNKEGMCCWTRYLYIEGGNGSVRIESAIVVTPRTALTSLAFNEFTLFLINIHLSIKKNPN